MRGMPDLQPRLIPFSNGVVDEFRDLGVDFREVFVGFDLVKFRVTLAVFVEETKIKFGIGVALVGSLLEPFRGGC